MARLHSGLRHVRCCRRGPLPGLSPWCIRGSGPPRARLSEVQRLFLMVPVQARARVPLGPGLLRELNPGPLAPEARIMPLDQAAMLACAVAEFECGCSTAEGRMWHVAASGPGAGWPQRRWASAPGSARCIKASEALPSRSSGVESLSPWAQCRPEPTSTGARAAPGIEPGTSRTLSENHATRPSSQMLSLPAQLLSNLLCSVLA